MISGIHRETRPGLWMGPERRREHPRRPPQTPMRRANWLGETKRSFDAGYATDLSLQGETHFGTKLVVRLYPGVFKSFYILVSIELPFGPLASILKKWLRLESRRVRVLIRNSPARGLVLPAAALGRC